MTRGAQLAAVLVTVLVSSVVAGPAVAEAAHPHTQANFSCLNERSIWIDNTKPQAYDATSDSDQQYAGWNLHVWEWTGAEWKHINATGWVYGVARENSHPWPWYSLATNDQVASSVDFRVPRHGYYAVSAETYWWENGAVPADHTHEWGRGEFTGGNSYCYIP